MEFELIRKNTEEYYKNLYSVNIENEEDLKQCLSNYGREYKGNFETQKKKLGKFLKNKFDKELKKKINFIESVENYEFSLPNPLVITVEWKRSRMWGSNPKAYTNYGFEGNSIGGCGYCKRSTATAEALNSHLGILQLLFHKEERRLNENPQPDRRSYIGYGSGYGAIPSFEGGVGVESHRSIIEGLGLVWRNISCTDLTDVYMISLGENTED